MLVFRALRPVLPSRVRLLDIAPTKGFSDYCTNASDIEYLSVDKVSSIAMKRMDIQQLDLAADTFDLVTCCHVLDYVTDDIQGLREIHRVLKPEGVAILQERFSEDRLTEEWGRVRADKRDRVRHYGRDFRDRVAMTGFRFVELTFSSGPLLIGTSSPDSELDLFRSRVDAAYGGLRSDLRPGRGGPVRLGATAQAP